jgi:asparagine synthase (glutamine-hydrolysing)
MTIFAGAYSFQSAPISSALRAALRSHLRSQANEAGSWQVHSQTSFFLVKWDSGAYPSPAWRSQEDGCSALAGDPILMGTSGKLSRHDQLVQIAPVGSVPKHSALQQCRGSFAFAHYNAIASTLHLGTDALGLRSIYYVIQDNCLIFATALRVLEALPQINKSLSVLGMAELCAFTLPLANRTPYENIHVLRECELLSASPGGIGLNSYDVWSMPQDPVPPTTNTAAHLHAVFRESVAVRLANETRVYSFLSGGMDSRAIVATLLDLGQKIEALNFSSNGSQDQRYAELFSEQAGESCQLHRLPGGVFPNFSLLALAAKSALESSQQTRVDRPQFIWSGDGGSVGLGHVYMDDAMLDAAERGDMALAIRHLLDFNGIALTNHLFTEAFRSTIPEAMLDDVTQEIHRYPRHDLGRQIYFFLLFNDQRRHLFKHFETIDQHGLELLTPFFDTQFLMAVAATPARAGVAHRLYGQFFDYLPQFARNTPWQTYPGHQACPIPGDNRLSYQWAPSAQHAQPGLHERIKVARHLLGAFDRDLRPAVFSPARVWLAALLHALGLRDCEHVVNRLRTYRKYQSIVQVPGTSHSSKIPSGVC